MLETELREIKSFTAGLAIPISIADPELPDCPLVFSNSAFEDLTGFPNSWSVGKNCRFLQGEKTDLKEVARIRFAMQENKNCVAVLTNYRANGEEFGNLLIISQVSLRHGRNLFIGCQFEFDLLTETDVAQRFAKDRSKGFADIPNYVQSLASIRKTAMKMRADAALLGVKNHLISRRLS